MIRERTFFEIAATLLPVLLLTGVLTRGLRPPQRGQKLSEWRFYLVMFGVLLGAFAELSALTAVTTGRPTNFDRIVVPLAIAFAIAGVGAALITPWLTRLSEDRPEWRNQYRLIRVGLTLTALFWCWSTAQLFRSTFETGDAERQLLREKHKYEREECVLRKSIYWPGSPNSIVGKRETFPRQLALDQVALIRARRAALTDGAIDGEERSELRILDQLLKTDVQLLTSELDSREILEKASKLEC